MLSCLAAQPRGWAVIADLPVWSMHVLLKLLLHALILRNRFVPMSQRSSTRHCPTPDFVGIVNSARRAARAGNDARADHKTDEGADRPTGDRSDRSTDRADTNFCYGSEKSHFQPPSLCEKSIGDAGPAGRVGLPVTTSSTFPTLRAGRTSAHKTGCSREGVHLWTVPPSNWLPYPEFARCASTRCAQAADPGALSFCLEHSYARGNNACSSASEAICSRNAITIRRASRFRSPLISIAFDPPAVSMMTESQISPLS